MRWLELLAFWRRIPASLLLSLLAVLAIILFSPESIARALSVDEFRAVYRVFLGPSFLLLCFLLVDKGVQQVLRARQQRASLRERAECLQTLTPEEKGYLAVYILQQRNTIYVGIDDGVMAGLVAKGITYRASIQGTLTEGFPFNLNSWARAALTDEPSLLDGRAGQPLTPRERLHKW